MSQYSTDTVWVGMDVHQDSITAAVLFGDDPEARVERLPGDLNAVRRMFRRLSDHGTPRSCYEASGAGYVLQRCLEHDGFHCEVIAPSLVPKKPGDRRKTDRLDALHLVRHYRAGNLVPVAVPSQQQEEIRQLVRSRLAVQSHIMRLKHRIVRVLATHGHRHTATRSNWTKKHRAWLRKLHRELTGPLQTVLAHHLEHLEYLEGQRYTLEAEIDRYARKGPYRRQVEALCCFRGVKVLTAMTILTELGDIRRFARPTGLMAFAGLVPSERSSGNVRRRGSITKCGSGELRRVLIEAAWHYRNQAGADLVMTRRRMGQDPEVVAIAIKAQHRLKRTFWKIASRKHTCTAVTATARELCGFIWSALWVISGQES
ncbi:MAG: IS110 family transposase [Candidatus Omnitrophica bacterium]|nr:IS110 family transposase [Candidatus Omnitrophota bacterium]